jgi:hypothetical protein
MQLKTVVGSSPLAGGHRLLVLCSSGSIVLARAVHAVIFDYMHACTHARTYVVVLPKESCPATVSSFVHSNKIDRPANVARNPWPGPPGMTSIMLGVRSHQVVRTTTPLLLLYVVASVLRKIVAKYTCLLLKLLRKLVAKKTCLLLKLLAFLLRATK